ncbi:MAG: OmpA family protein [Vampirovibrionales bacterium]|nr:OmpA family protein [Vampirovibrionales bacterium]
MAKKKKHPEHENLERWLVSYADFITLLFATFTALYALSQADLAKMKDVSAAIREGFQEQSIMNGIKTILQGKSPPTDNPNPIAKQQGAGPGVIGKYDSLTYQPGEVKKVEKTYSELRQTVSKINAQIKQEAAAAVRAAQQKAAQQKSQGSTDLKGTHAPNLGKQEEQGSPNGIDIAIQERGLKVSFDSRLLFEPGTAILKKQSEPTLDAIAKRLTPYNYTHVLHIEGHTDDEPISSAVFPSNWELSAGRASTVVRYLIRRHGFSPKSLVAVGYGDSQPIASNKTPDGRARNRRVDIIIYSQKVSDGVNPSKQFANEQELLDGNQSQQVSGSGSENLLKSEERDEFNRLIQPGNNGMVKLLIEEPDGTRREYHPMTVPAKTSKPVINTRVNTKIPTRAKLNIKPSLGTSSKSETTPPTPPTPPPPQ